MKDFTQPPKFETPEREQHPVRTPFGPPDLPQGVPPRGPEASGATASLILGLLGISCLWVVGSIPAIVLGFRARGLIRASGGRLSGGGMALGGIFTGLIGLVLGAWLPLFFVQMAPVVEKTSFETKPVPVETREGRSEDPGRVEPVESADQ